MNKIRFISNFIFPPVYLIFGLYVGFFGLKTLSGLQNLGFAVLLVSYSIWRFYRILSNNRKQNEE